MKNTTTLFLYLSNSTLKSRDKSIISDATFPNVAPFSEQ
jgi:hypothetical protein